MSKVTDMMGVNLRFLLGIVMAAVLVVVTGLIHPVTGATEQYSQQVQAGLDYFKTRADEQLILAENLLTAIKSGDLAQAETAYVDSRPPYEEIEVFAVSFEQEDRDIDARPYAFGEGEMSPDFRGFHRIEAFIYRDKNLTSAIPYGEQLVASIKSLQNELSDTSNFDAALNFNGMIALSTEVPAKKISSEEETWSDQSLLIFKHNWIGIHSQYEPFAELVRAKNPTVADQVEQAYQNCMNLVEPYFTDGSVAAVPYSSLDNQVRGEISEAGYQFRDALVAAQEALGLN